jgi:hypothetical protein
MDVLFNPIYVDEQEYMTLNDVYNSVLYAQDSAKSFFIINFELSRDLINNNRRVYNIFNLLADIGGLQAIVFTFGQFLVSYIAPALMENYLINTIFTWKDDKTSPKSAPIKFKFW